MDYHSPALFIPLVDALKFSGIDAHCPQLPTSDLNKLNIGDVENPKFDLGPPVGGYLQGEQDVEVVNNVLEPLLQQGKRVLLLGHSTGGGVATEAARKKFKSMKEPRRA